ncbi:MAG TPA: class I SAM-dependent methyltransferase [Stellaceae bacterium]|nr:class I SAM-dependent methyltransferase [Stellaceae bacterium]
MSEMTAELRYGFGKNWAEFVSKNFNEEVLNQSQTHLADFLRVDTLRGKLFLDIGCGSGLHSLAAYRLGAERIISFDYDRDSVATTERLRRYAGDPAHWTVMHGSVLDRKFMEGLEKADIVYSWGVLHHTGDMWNAVRNAAIPMKADGIFFIALYASEAYVDPPPEYWLKIKRLYNQHGLIGRRLMEWWYVWKFHFVPTWRSGGNPLHAIWSTHHRGMKFWTDVRDWLGGYPMEFAGMAETRDFCKQELGLDLINLGTGEANTEFLFCHLGKNQQWTAIEAQRAQRPLARPFSKIDGFSFAAYEPSLRDSADGNDAPRRSRVMVYEDGRPLGLNHSLHDHIAKYGSGRFSHWGDNIYFSTPDNSDPNTNSRTYTYCVSF